MSAAGGSRHKTAGDGNLAVVRSYQEALTVKSMTTIGHVFIPLNRGHDGMVPTDNDQAHFENLPVPLALWEPFQQCLSKHLSCQ